MRSSRHARAAALLACVAVAFSALAFDEETVSTLVQEDGVVEWAGAVGLLVATWFYARGFRSLSQAGERDVRRWVVLALAILFLVSAGEEISWGQRILGLETPDRLAEVSAQDEANLHNLELFQGVFGILFFGGVCGVLFVVVPVVALHARAGRWLARVLPVVPLWLAVGFAATLVLPSVAKALLPGVFEGALAPRTRGLAEIREAVLELLIALAAVVTYRELRAPSPD